MEGRIKEVKEEMTGWFEQGKVKAPCLLLLDGLDTLVAPENEVSKS